MTTNTVDVDPAALAAEAQRALAGATPILDATATPEAGLPGAGGIDPQMPPAQSWRPLVDGAVPMIRMTVFAQWQIPAEHQAEFVTSLSATLDLLFPGGLDGKWAPCVRLLACSAGIVITNYTANGYKLPPLGLKKPDDKKPAGEQPRAA